VASCSVIAAPTLSSTEPNRPSPKFLVLAQARIIRSASATLSVPNMAMARSLSDRSVHSSIIQVARESLSYLVGADGFTHDSPATPRGGNGTVGMIAAYRIGIKNGTPLSSILEFYLALFD